MSAAAGNISRRGLRPPVAALLAGAWLAGAGAEGLAMNGEVSLGWRGVSVDGDRAKYRQQINLDDGPRLFDLRIDWQEAGSAPSSSLAPDRLLVDVDNLGGDPFETLRIEAGRTGRYSASYRRHESEYFYDDLLIRPEAADAEGSTGGDFRRFDFERVQEQATLRVHLSPRATVELDLDRYELLAAPGRSSSSRRRSTSVRKLSPAPSATAGSGPA